MPERGNDFAGKLISQQSMNPKRQEKYRKEMEKMYDVKVEGGTKILSVIIVAIRLIIGLGCLVLFLFNPLNLSSVFRLICGVGAVMLLSISSLGAFTIWKGAFKHRSHGNYAAYSVFYGSLAIATLWLLASGFDSGIPTSVAWNATPVFIVVLGATKIIINWIKQSELNTREQMLNLEVKMAELTEQLKSGK